MRYTANGAMSEARGTLAVGGGRDAEAETSADDYLDGLSRDGLSRDGLSRDGLSGDGPPVGGGLTVGEAVALARGSSGVAPQSVASGPAGWATSASLRRVSLAGLGLIALLNCGDVVTTRVLLARGAVESNPLAGLLLGGYRVEVLKFGLLVLLAMRFRRTEPSVGRVAASWFVAGFYFLTIVSNLLILRRL